jgi:hypothetical protein
VRQVLDTLQTRRMSRRWRRTQSCSSGSQPSGGRWLCCRLRRSGSGRLALPPPWTPPLSPAQSVRTLWCTTCGDHVAEGIVPHDFTCHNQGSKVWPVQQTRHPDRLLNSEGWYGQRSGKALYTAAFFRFRQVTAVLPEEPTPTLPFRCGPEAGSGCAGGAGPAAAGGGAAPPGAARGRAAGHARRAALLPVPVRRQQVPHCCTSISRA